MYTHTDRTTISKERPPCAAQAGAEPHRTMSDHRKGEPPCAAQAGAEPHRTMSDHRKGEPRCAARAGAEPDVAQAGAADQPACMGPAESDRDSSDHADRAAGRYHEVRGEVLGRCPRHDHGDTLTETHATLGDAKRLAALPCRGGGDKRSVRSKLIAVEEARYRKHHQRDGQRGP